MSVSLGDLVPEVARKAGHLVKELDRRGIRYLVTSTLRTQAEQVALFAQGRAELEVVQALRRIADMRPLHPSENRYTVTNADGVTKLSLHQGGRAIDIVPLDERGRPSWNYPAMKDEYLAIGDVARKQGWTCGQDWPPIDPDSGLGADPPHYQT